MRLLSDTGVLYALADRRDAWHQRSKQYVTTAAETLLAPVTVIPEVTYLLHTKLGAAAERSFVRSLVAGEVELEPLLDADVARAATLLDVYPEIGFVDASVVAVAERLKLERIATTDRRHFGRVRPSHRDAFVLVP